MSKYIISLDAGTSSVRTVITDPDGRIIASKSKQTQLFYPQPGWVEQDAGEMWQAQLYTMREALSMSDLVVSDIAAIAIANQRETSVLWERDTGRLVCNAIVWQCRRSAPICDRLKAVGIEETVRRKTGLTIDAYFSATKVMWALENVPGIKEKAARGKLLFGNVDAWLIWNLTGGKSFVTDYTNASRTMMFDIWRLQWDDELLGIYGISRAMLPEARPSAGVFGYTDPAILGQSLPIMGVLGDQQASLFGQVCFDEGSAKVTYGTGAFMLLNTGERISRSQNGLLSTVAYGIGDKATYALEGSVFAAGTAIDYLIDPLGLIGSVQEANVLAGSIPDAGGAYFVPAFNGLGAPYWDMYARGAMTGITQATGKAQFVRAVMESIAFSVKDILDAMGKDAGAPVKRVNVDGGVSKSDFLMQFQADISGIPVIRAKEPDSTAMGAAYIAGMASGVWSGLDDIKRRFRQDTAFEPSMPAERRDELYEGWQRAVRKCRAR